MKDYRITAKVQNNFLLRKIEDAGYDSVNQFCLAKDLRATEVGKYVNLKKAPWLPERANTIAKWSTLAIRLSDLLSCMPEDLFPPQHIPEALAVNTGSFEATLEEVEGLLDSRKHLAIPPDKLIELEDEKTAINAELDRLRPREKNVIERRMGLNGKEPSTLAEIGADMGLTQERIRQIELRGIRMMKRPGAVKRLANSSVRCEVFFEGSRKIKASQRLKDMRRAEDARAWQEESLAEIETMKQREAAAQAEIKTWWFAMPTNPDG